MRMDRLCRVSAVSVLSTLAAANADAGGRYSLPFEPLTLARLATPGSHAERVSRSPLPVAAREVQLLSQRKRARSAYAGDLAGIEQRSTLRALMLREQGSQPASSGTELERQLLRAFAQARRLAVDVVTVDSPRELVTGLRDGRGDVVIGEVPVDVDNKTGIARTVALRQTRYLIVISSDNKNIKRPSDLYGLRVGLSKYSPAWRLLQRLSAGHEPVERIPTEGISEDELYGQLARGVFDFTVVQGDGRASPIAGRKDLRVAFPLTKDKPVTWLVRKDSPALLAALNAHLNKSHQLAWRVQEARQDDLAGIRNSGVLRVITRPDPDNYFLNRGERAGFEYDMIREFALSRGLRMEVLVADSDAQMLAWLKGGIGDVVTARVDTDLVDTDAAYAASRVYHYVAPVLVGRADLANPKSLHQRRIVVKRDSLEARILNDHVRESREERFDLVEVAPDRSVAEMADQVAEGEADFTVVEGPRLQEVLAYRSDLRAVTSLADQHPYRFTLRAVNPELLSALNAFLKQEYGTEFYNAARRRYFQSEELYAMDGGAFDRISPYDDLVQRYADRYSFDWRLIVAQMYEESRFDPDAVSAAGARGLMQVLPLTARAMGFRDLSEPDRAIHAGIKYLARQRQRFEETLPVDDRTWFALAAYHAGFDRVRSARRRAVKLGLDPNRWFGHVEKGMLDISRNASQGTYRGGATTVLYVREIRSRYEAYVHLQPATTIASL
ncbi:MAG: transglycosylase SLT domain-containing protein [Chromatiales bacterium]